jgi:hypothetical protein
MRAAPIACGVWLALVGCGPREAVDDPPAAQAPPAAAANAATGPTGAKPAAALDPSAPASKRIVGKWWMSLNQVPSAVLDPRLAKLKNEGKADRAARMEYTFSETEFVVDTYGAAGRNRLRYHYEIMSESGDELVLRRIDEHGKPHEVTVTVSADELAIQTGDSQKVKLQRID